MIAGDFGNLVHSRPQAIVRPLSIEALAQHVRLAAREGVEIATRGCGHSVFGQSQLDGGVVLDMRELRHVRVDRRVDGHVARVGPGATWAEVLRATVPLGLAPPVLTDYVGLSVGGTLSVGGVGASSFAYGTQTDQVRALTVVTGTGDIVRCSPSDNAALFDTVRATLGMVSIMVEVELPLVRIPARVRHYRIPHESMDALLANLQRLLELSIFDQLSAVGIVDDDGRWHFHIDAVLDIDAGDRRAECGVASADVTEFSYLDYCTRLDAVVESWQSTGLWQAPHPWLDVFIPSAALPDFARATLDTLAPATLGTDGAMILIYPVSHAHTPCLPLSSHPNWFLFDILRCNKGASPAEVEALLLDNRRIYSNALDVGGVLYPISAVQMSQRDWQHHFGDSWRPLLAAKATYDPHHVFASQYTAAAFGTLIA